MTESPTRQHFETVYCIKCGKKLMRKIRLSDEFGKGNCVLEFVFGKKRELPQDKIDELLRLGGTLLPRENRFVIHMEILGPVRMRCTSHNCDHENVIMPF